MSGFEAKSSKIRRFAIKAVFKTLNITYCFWPIITIMITECSEYELEWNVMVKSEYLTTETH